MNLENYERIRAVLADDPEVHVAYLFGSHARDQATDDSDIDLGVCFASTPSFRQLDELAAQLKSVVGDTDIDLIDIGDSPPELAFRIIDEGRLLYCATEFERVELEAGILSRYGDYLPVLRRQREQIIKGGENDRAVRRYRKAFGETRRLLEQIRASDGKAGD